MKIAKNAHTRVLGRRLTRYIGCNSLDQTGGAFDDRGAAQCRGIFSLLLSRLKSAIWQRKSFQSVVGIHGLVPFLPLKLLSGLPLGGILALSTISGGGLAH